MMASSGSAVGLHHYPSSMRRTAPAAASRIPVPQSQRRDDARHVSAPGQRSRLQDMQDTYQKKLLREKEEKMLAIYNKQQVQQEQALQKVQRQDSGRGIVRDFLRERKELENHSKGSANLLSRDVHFQKKRLERKKTSNLNGDTLLQDDNNGRPAQRPELEEQRRNEEQKEHEMRTYKKQWQETQAQSSPKHAQGVVRSKPLAPIKHQTHQTKGKTQPTLNNYESTDSFSYDDEDEYAKPPTKPKKVPHRKSKPVDDVLDSPEPHKPTFQKPVQPGKVLNPKKVAPPIARRKPTEIKVKKEKLSDYQKWQAEQGTEREERLKKHADKQPSQKEHYSVDYDRELAEEMNSAKERRKTEYDEMLAKERELEEMIAKHKSDLSKMSHDKSSDEEDADFPPQKPLIKNSVKSKPKPTRKPTHQFNDDTSSPPPYHQPTEEDYESRAGEFKSRKKQKPVPVKPAEDDYESRAGEFKPKERYAPAKPKPKRKMPSKEPEELPPFKPPSPVAYDTSFYEQAADEEAGDVDRVPCPNCGRKFAAERLSKHTAICKNAGKKKRKVFDSTKKRVEGTDHAEYVRRGEHLKNDPPAKSSNWRKKHEEFVNAIRGARETQAYVDKGGKLSDLPPPPPAENPDYKQCPYCERRFNPGAAERHIPKCKDARSRPKPLRKK